MARLVGQSDGVRDRVIELHLGVNRFGRSPDNDFFGPERLEELLEGARCDQAPAVVKRCVDEVEAFAPDGLRDDATIVVLCRS